MRAVIYARYSSDNQREASIDDQVEVCRRYIQAHGWQPTRYSRTVQYPEPLDTALHISR